MARRKSHKPQPVGDIGPETEAALAGATIKIIEEPGKTPVRRKYQDHLLEVLARPRKYAGRDVGAQITERQKNAGIVLHHAWCMTQTSPERNGIYVDATPDWDGVILRQIERDWKYTDVSRGVPRNCADVVKLAVHMQIHPYHGFHGAEARDRMETLRRGLDALADYLGL